MKIAICGAGVAGSTLAYWLLRSGHEVTLIEHAPALRTGGYVIDFWGIGYDVAERMGVLPQLLRAGYNQETVKFVDARGRKKASFTTDVFERALNGRFTSIPRGDLIRALFGAADGRAEVLFDDTIRAIDAGDDGVRLHLESGAVRDFDLLVGADGQHSVVRRLAFGPDDRFEKSLGCYVAACEVEGYRPREPATYASYATPGTEIARFTLRDDRMLFLFMFDSARLPGAEPTDEASRKAVLRDVFAGQGWETPRILDALDDAPEIYFDRMSQIVMPGWSSGRIILIGDAAGCVSLLAGEGAGLAIAEAYVLAGELAASPSDASAAFDRYERLMRPLIESKQRSARRFAFYFAPRTRFGIWLRNQITHLLGLPWIGEALVTSDLRDDFDLPSYG